MIYAKLIAQIAISLALNGPIYSKNIHSTTCRLWHGGKRLLLQLETYISKALLCALISASLHDADKSEDIETVVLTVSDDLLGFEWELELCRELWLWEFSWGDILVPKRRKILLVIKTNQFKLFLKTSG